MEQHPTLDIPQAELQTFSPHTCPSRTSPTAVFYLLKPKSRSRLLFFYLPCSASFPRGCDLYLQVDWESATASPPAGPVLHRPFPVCFHGLDPASLPPPVSLFNLFFTATKATLPTALQGPPSTSNKGWTPQLPSEASWDLTWLGPRYVQGSLPGRFFLHVSLWPARSSPSGFGSVRLSWAICLNLQHPSSPRSRIATFPALFSLRTYHWRILYSLFAYCLPQYSRSPVRAGSLFCLFSFTALFGITITVLNLEQELRSLDWMNFYFESSFSIFAVTLWECALFAVTSHVLYL